MAAIYKGLPIPLYAALIDLQKAFDSIRRDQLFGLLTKHQFPMSAINLVKMLYQNESSALLLNRNRSNNWSVNKGVRQGASSSPLIFNLFPEELITRLRTYEGISFDGVHQRTILRRRPHTHGGYTGTAANAPGSHGNMGSGLRPSSKCRQVRIPSTKCNTTPISYQHMREHIITNGDSNVPWLHQIEKLLPYPRIQPFEKGQKCQFRP